MQPSTIVKQEHTFYTIQTIPHLTKGAIYAFHYNCILFSRVLELKCNIAALFTLLTMIRTLYNQ